MWRSLSNFKPLQKHQQFVFSSRFVAVYSDSDSSQSSLERRSGGPGSGDGGSGSGRPPRKTSSHKRPRRKRAAIPVATPRVPSLPSANSTPSSANLPPSGMPLPLSARLRDNEKGTIKHSFKCKTNTINWLQFISPSLVTLLLCFFCWFTVFCSHWFLLNFLNSAKRNPIHW